MSQSRTSRRDRRTQLTQKRSAEALATRRRRLVIATSAVVVVAIAAVSLVVALSNRGSADDTNPLAAMGTAVYQGIPSQGPTLGNPAAKVKVIEYADYQCPYCANFALNDEPQLISDFVKTGLITYEYQPMPIISHLSLTDPNNESVLAAEASYCAGDQGQFWNFHHELFSKWTGENVGTFTSQNLITYAADSGLDVSTFTSCLLSNTYRQTVIDSRSAGIKAGVTGTPTFVIDGKVTELTTSGYAGLKQQIQDAIDASAGN